MAGGDGDTSPPAPIEVAAKGLCPRCGAHTLFDGAVSFAPACRACGLDFAAFNVGDGPAAFLTLIWGTVVVILAVWLELAANPPWWVHVLLWLPLVITGTVVSLRIAKGMLLALEYRNAAREGRIAPPDTDTLP
ncbi:DUF983 domain-containing protein [Stakelama sp. CBK3Z-3]|uniref:DUF983 domain-containing protein n=1 Tax=Stakelama flava TaxID=2860338 RepID=A0ABS6XLM5_9SPHN|nr:DUF983 domain-containing protein [Stakelama flava]